MHAVIINGSPRIQKNSNTDKILQKFTAGFCEAGNTFELYSLSDRNIWDDARLAFDNNDNIIFALPLFVECVPGLMLEFLETLSPKNSDTKLSFILQSGFAEGAQLRVGEKYLEILTEKLNCTYGGTLTKGNNFGIRVFEGAERDRITEPYKEMGELFAEEGDFFDEKFKTFTGPEMYPLPLRLFIDLLFKTSAKKAYQKIAQQWGCDKPLEYQPYA